MTRRGPRSAKPFRLETTNGSSGSYVKIGHGDDLIQSLSSLSGQGDRAGDVEVGAASDITLVDAMIGYVNSSSRADAAGGTTQVGVSRDDPADPNGGTLRADAASEFQGADELRFYVPRRGGIAGPGHGHVPVRLVSGRQDHGRLATEKGGILYELRTFLDLLRGLRPIRTERREPLPAVIHEQT